jgi:hypothetical protein
LEEAEKKSKKGGGLFGLFGGGNSTMDACELYKQVSDFIKFDSKHYAFIPINL